MRLACSTFAVVAGTCALLGCSRDLSAPPLPGPGTIQGRVLYAVPGQLLPAPAKGAVVTILSTSLGAVADAQGRFVIEGVTMTQGRLLVQLDRDGDGTPDLQSLLPLESLKAGPGRDLAIGDLVLAANAQVRGRVTRANVTTVGGQAGTAIFVPQGPFLTQTADDGSFLLSALPAGTLALTFFRDGYEPQEIDGISLGGGQDFVVRDVNLQPSLSAPRPGTISGRATLTPALADASAATVSAFPVLGAPVTVHATAAGDFSTGAIAAGLYRVEVSLSGYATAVIANVLLAPAQEVQLAVNLLSDGVSVTPPPSKTSTCVAGVRCALPDVCKIGQVNCATGSPVCGVVGKALDGIVCGPNQVCQTGACTTVCTAGLTCQPANACHGGAVACENGVASCGDTGAILADGSSCGASKVCHQGACGACVAGLSCASANPCHAGATSCDTGVSTCGDSGFAVADGTPCGSSLACQGGVCGACVAGKPCTPPGFSCHAGQTTCATGREVCTDLGSALSNGTACGASQVCASGACVACAAGSACTPASACHAGAIACSTGAPVCIDQNTNLTAGTSCGANQVCDGGGACIGCQTGVACAPANRCHAGAVTCNTGAVVCADTSTPVADGSSCGTNLVCKNGACNACTAGAACAPANPCHGGNTSCATGAPVCQDAGTFLADGASCGADLVCRAGGCGACAVGAACDGAAGHAPAPASPNPCLAYATSCSAGTPACAAGANLSDGTACGAGQICRSGACTATGFELVLQTPAPHALPNQAVSVTLVLRDFTHAPVLTPTTVTLAAPAGAQAPTPASTSAADGTVTFTPTLGRAAGLQHFTATAPSAYAPLDVAITADAPADGLLIPIANAAHVNAASTAAGAAPALPTGLTTGIAASSDGTLYFSDQATCVVKRVLPSGQLDVVAGTGTCSGRSAVGPATSLSLSSPRGLALDEPGHTLYFAETGNQVVRALDLSTGTLSTYAGVYSGSSTATDGVLANTTTVSNPNWIALGTGSPPNLYVQESFGGRIRKVDGATQRISTVLSGTGNICPAAGVSLAAVNIVSSTNSSAGSIAVDQKGSLFVSGTFCGADTNGVQVFGVARLNADGSLTLVAGGGGGLSSAGLSAVAVSLAEPPVIAFDTPVPGQTQNLYLSVPAGNYLARVDGGTQRFDQIAGTGVSGASGNFAAASGATFTSPLAIALRPGTRDLYLAEGTTAGVGMVAGANPAAVTSATFAGVAPANVYPDQGQWLAAQVKDGSGAGLAGRPVTFAVDPARLSGSSLSSSRALTDGSGVASVNATAGLALGTYGVTVTASDLHGTPLAGSPLSLPYSAVAPPANLVFSVVDQGHLFGDVPGPGVTAQIHPPRSVSVGPSGTAYLVDDNSQIFRMDPSGLVTDIVPNSWGFVPYSLSVDEVSGVLYFNDVAAATHYVRALDLASGALSVTAGSPTGTSADGPLSSAAIDPTRLRVIGGKIYLGDKGSGRLRRIDPAAGIIETFIPRLSSTALPGTPAIVPGCTNTGPLVFNFCSQDDFVCSVVAAPPPDGRIYVSGLFCGAAVAGGNIPSLVRVELDGSLTLIATLDAPAAIATDAAGNLFIAKPGGTSAHFGYYAATGGSVGPSPGFVPRAQGSSGFEYVDLSATSFVNPTEIVFGAGHLWVADKGLNAVRVIW